MVSLFGLEMYRIVCTLLCFICAWDIYAWNALGHKLVAQIAYQHLTPEAKSIYDEYNHALDSYSPSPDFITAATWLDQIRRYDVHWFDALHYIDIPFSRTSSSLPSVQGYNALLGIQQAIAVLSSRKSSRADKGLSLRILIHLVGDIHQPLHTITQISKKFPRGDRGGNLVPLGKNPVARNLHQYWDNGGGFLLGRSNPQQIRYKAHQLEEQWSCKLSHTKMKPDQWIEDSHEIALNQAYTISPYRVPSKSYQLMAQETSQKQILFAGCRLAKLLNRIVQQQKEV